MKKHTLAHRRVLDYAYLDIHALYRDFHLSSSGYTDEEVEESRLHFGKNSVTNKTSDTVLYRLRRAFVNPFTIILFVLAIIDFMMNIVLASHYTRNPTTFLIILCMLLISGIIRFIQELRSKRIADFLDQMVSAAVLVRRNGEWKQVAVQDLVVGDQVRLLAGDRVPADIRIIAANDLFLSQALITGESMILEKKTDILSKEHLQDFAQYTNIAFMGCSIIGGNGEGIVLAVGEDTVYGGLAAKGTNEKNEFDKGAISIARVLIRFMMVLIPIVFIVCALSNGNWLSAFLFALSVAVGLTPELLPMVINACLAKGSVAMEHKQTIVKNINAMQGFGSMDVLCVDKTGTLTGEEITLEYYMDVFGNECQKVLDYAYINSYYHTGVVNPLDKAILRYQTIPDHRTRFQRLLQMHKKIDELPFDYQRKFVDVLVENEADSLMIIKGNMDAVCARCTHVEYKGKRYVIDDAQRKSMHAIVDEMLEDGMKVLAIAYKSEKTQQLTAETEQHFTLLGYLAFFDAPKQSAAKAMEQLQKLHVGVRVLTGDQQAVAVSICRRLGVDTTKTLTGSELAAISEEELSVKIEYTSIFAELSPKQKAQIVQILKENGHTVGFLGDGLNDLPAIVTSDVGISIDTAAEAVKEAADVILLKKDLNVLEEGIKEGRKAFATVMKYIKITASSNFGNIFSIVIAGACLPFLPMTSLQILLLNLLYDVLCLSLPWDHVDEEMCLQPLEWSGKTLSRFMRFFAPISSFFDILTFLYLFFMLCPSICGGPFASLSDIMQVRFIALFQTGWFLESMWTQVLILHLLRSAKLPFVQSRPSHFLILVTVFGTFIFTLVTFTPVGSCLGLTSLPPVYFIFLLFVVMAYLFLVSLAKIRYNKRYHELL